MSRGIDTAVALPPSVGTRSTMIVSVFTPSEASVRSWRSTLGGSWLPCASVRLSLPTSRMSVAPSRSGGEFGTSDSTEITSVVLTLSFTRLRVTQP